MLFNSLQFAVFLPVVFFLYWFVANKNYKAQNVLLLLASYFFYACWDWRFMFLLIFSTVLDYYTGLKMGTASTQLKKKFWFWLSIGINLGFLGVFKYYNFFADTFATAVSAIGWQVSPWTLDVVLPVGISFYTFHGLSYVIDIYKNKIAPEKNVVDYAVFVSFFPLLVAGPIERATHLLPQIQTRRVFNYSKAVDGMRQILWGLFKKIVIADNCAGLANQIFGNHNAYNGSTHVLGAVLFSIQIYCDFSGYSDIAIGTARLFGIDLLRNFAFPYFSRDIAEFWRRWHISLSSWFRDYLYIPLGGSKGGTWMKIRNTFIIFLVSGLWHGANWTFVIWGLLNALYIMPSIIFNTNRTNLDIVAKGRHFPTIKDGVSIALTFCLTTLAWIFFRAENLPHALNYLSKTFTLSIFRLPQSLNSFGPMSFYQLLAVVPVFMAVEWAGRDQQYAIARLGINWYRPLRWALYYGIILALFTYYGKQQQFIYFQF